MPDYNPNSIWGSKEKKYVYTPPGDPTSYTRIPQEPQPSPQKRPPPSGGKPSGTGPTGPERPSFFDRHRLLFFTLGILLLIALVGIVYNLVLPPATPNIAITFSAPSSVMVGQPFPLTVTVSNESKSVLQDVNLNISLPEGLSFVGEDPAQRTLAESVGTLSSQTINPPQEVQVIATANPGTTQNIGAQLTYQTAATAATQFQNTANASLAISAQSALSLSYNAPSSIFSGQDFDIAVNYQNNTTSTLQGVQLTMQYPPAYHFVSSSSTSPTGAASNIWSLGTLPANATGTLVITGNIVGPAQAQYQLTGIIGASFSGQNYSAASTPVSFAVTPSPLSLSIALNNSPTYVAGEGDTLSYVLTYKNNSNVTFQSVNISASLLGRMYDFPSLKTNGSFNSQSDVITWYAANTSALASLAPGQSGTVDFTINTLASFPIQRINDKNYLLSVTAKAQSPTVPPNTAGANTTSITALTTKVGGDIELSSNGYINETTPGITNTGPYPPKVDQPTKYTIHWDIVNYSTDAENVTVSAYLQSGSTFTGIATSTGLASTSLPVYDPGTGEVTWTIPFIPATTGVISPPVQAIFQITNTPAVNQVGQAIKLLGPATLTATDAYTNSTVTQTAPAITTQLPNDPSLSGQSGMVTQ
jgi:uncharacterized repeat protein (TIGR01451 family)